MTNRNVILRFVVVAVIVSILSTQYATIGVTMYLPTFSAPHYDNDSPLDVQKNWHETSRNAIPGSESLRRNVSSILPSNVTTTEKENLLTSPPPHPHAGARHANGSWGYVADVTLVRRFFMARYESLLKHQVPWNHTSLESHLYLYNTKEWEVVCNSPPREGKERKAGWRLLTQKVQVDGPDPVSSSANPDGNTPNPRSDQYPKILCAIYTYDKRREMISAVAETWGWKCDGFLAASTQTIHLSYNTTTTTSSSTFVNWTQPIHGLGSVDLPHLGPEQYANMWQKTRSILAYMHDYYLNEFDFFFVSGDDTYVIVENLRRTLQSLGTAAWVYPLYLGHWVPFRQGSNDTTNYFVGGGPGYVLNRKSLQLFVQTVSPTCQPNLLTSSEDRVLGECFRTIGIVGNHSVDATMAQRFHGMDPHDTCTMKGESGFFGNLYRFWALHYGFRTGFNLTSSQSVSFHRLTTAKHLKRIHAILYQSCPPNTTLGNILGSSLSSSLVPG